MTHLTTFYIPIPQLLASEFSLRKTSGSLSFWKQVIEKLPKTQLTQAHPKVHNMKGKKPEQHDFYVSVKYRQKLPRVILLLQKLQESKAEGEKRDHVHETCISSPGYRDPNLTLRQAVLQNLVGVTDAPHEEQSIRISSHTCISKMATLTGTVFQQSCLAHTTAGWEALPFRILFFHD